MSLLLPPPIVESGPLVRLDPRWKLLGFGFCIAGTAILHTPLFAGGMLGLAWFLALLGRVPLRWLRRRLSLALVPLLPFVVLLPFLMPQRCDDLALGPLAFSPSGFIQGGTAVLKGLAILTFTLTLIAVTAWPDLFRAAQGLRVPNAVILTVMLCLRYIFVLYSELMRLQIALRVRGYQPRTNTHTYRTTAATITRLFERGGEHAEQVGHAMRCRGFDGRFRALGELRNRPTDIGFALLALLVAIAAVWGDVRNRG